MHPEEKKPRCGAKLQKEGQEVAFLQKTTTTTLAALPAPCVLLSTNGSEPSHCTGSSGIGSDVHAVRGCRLVLALAEVKRQKARRSMVETAMSMLAVKKQETVAHHDLPL